MTSLSIDPHSYGISTGRQSNAAVLRGSANVFSSVVGAGTSLALGGSGFGSVGNALDHVFSVGGTGLGTGLGLGNNLIGSSAGTDGGIGELGDLISLQVAQQGRMQTFTAQTNILKMEHESRMAAVRNMRA